MSFILPAPFGGDETTVTWRTIPPRGPRSKGPGDRRPGLDGGGPTA